MDRFKRLCEDYAETTVAMTEALEAMENREDTELSVEVATERFADRERSSDWPENALAARASAISKGSKQG
ncbi:MAG: hypothetical protein JJT96_05720 [Opitutales bacterium]|nr:hypothetical protein [Opitutales bacterium]